MKTPSFNPHLPAALIFALGILASTALTTGLTWAGLEATQYGFVTATNEHFNGLSCPQLMMRSETAIVREVVDNPSSMEVTPIVSVALSKPGLPENRELQVSVPPGGTQRLEWTITPANIDRKFFIFAQATRSESYPLPEAQALCGILVLDLPFASGMQVLTAWLAFALVCIPLGLWLFGLRREHAYRLPGAMKALAVTALLGLLVSLPGLWLPGVGCLIVTALLTVGLLPGAMQV